MKHLGQADARDELTRRLTALRPDSTALWGRMTAHQAVCHLNDSFLGTMGEKKLSPASGWFQRTIMKWCALNLPMPWPKGVPTRPEVDQFQGGTRPVEFERDRKALLATMERFSSAGAPYTTHPIFAEMEQGEWLRWGYLHIDHHLRQFGV